MLSKCANPGCPAPFLYLHEGKLFRLDTGSEDLPTDKPSKKTVRNLRVFLAVRASARQSDAELQEGCRSYDSPLAGAARPSRVSFLEPCGADTPFDFAQGKPVRPWLKLILALGLF